jgi:hypothetical protein
MGFRFVERSSERRFFTMVHEGARPVSIRPTSGCERFSRSVFQKDDHKGAQLRADQAFDSIRFEARTNRPWHDHRTLCRASETVVIVG